MRLTPLDNSELDSPEAEALLPSGLQINTNPVVLTYDTSDTKPEIHAFKANVAFVQSLTVKLYPSDGSLTFEVII